MHRAAKFGFAPWSRMIKLQKVFEQVVPFFRVLYYQWVRITGKMPVPLFQTFCRFTKIDEGA